MFNFSKRINRLTFAAGLIISYTVAFSLFWLVDFLLADAVLEGSVGTIIILLIGLPLLLYWVALLRQRANDISGKYSFLLLFFAFTAFGMFILLFWPSEDRANKYGHKPRPGISLK